MKVQGLSLIMAVVNGEADWLVVTTKNLWAPKFQHPLSIEDCENLIAKFSDLGMHLREIVLKQNIQLADTGETAEEGPSATTLIKGGGQEYEKA